MLACVWSKDLAVEQLWRAFQGDYSCVFSQKLEGSDSIPFESSLGFHYLAAVGK